MANTLKFGNGKWYGKEGTILAYNDENYNYKPLPFNFSRDSKATVVNKDGLIETVGSGQPRIDYKDDSKGALLLEPSRTNYDSESLNFTTSFMSNSSGIQSSSLTSKIAPNGSNDSVYKITKATDNSDPYLGRSGVSFTDIKMVFSVWLWTDENQSKDVLFLVYRDVTQEVQTKNITLTTTPTRYFIEATFTTTPSNVSYRIDLDGVSSNQYIYAWGKQLEQGSYPTSYIPTQGSIVTRLADSCSQTVPDGVIGQTEGTLYTEINITKLLGTTTRSIIRLGSAVDLVDFSFLGTLNNSIRAVIRTSANTRFQAVFEIQSVGVYKLAIGYKSNDSVFYVNGVQINNTINTSFTMPSIEDITYNYSNELNDSVNQTKLYNTRLSNTELAALTQV